MQDNYSTDSTNSGMNEISEPELTHSDKMTGVFSEPGITFSKIAKFPPKTIDWFLPMLILMLLVAVTQILVMSNEEIAFQVRKQAEERIDKSFDEAVEKGQMTREEADQQKERVLEQMEMGRGAVGMIIQTVSILVFGFIFFFILSGIYFFFAKVVFKAEGSYASAMVAAGLPAYITMIQVVVAAILALLMGRLISDTSIASFIDADKSTFTGWLLGKLDPVSIWVYSVVAIGLAKMFHSDSTAKYFYVVFGVWILGSLLLFVISKAVPFLSFLAG